MVVRFKGTLFERKGKYGTRIDATFDEEWCEESFLRVFEYEDVPEKDSQRLWSANKYEEGARRGGDGLLSNYGAVLDFDCGDVGELDRIADAMSSTGFAYAIYSSWSHQMPNKTHTGTQQIGTWDCFRLVMPYDREVTPAEHRSLVDALIGFEVPPNPDHYFEEAHGRIITTEKGKQRMALPRGWDPTSSEPSRGFFVPTPSAILEVKGGRPLCVDAILSRPTTAQVTARRPRAYLAPTPTAEGAMGMLERALDKLGWGLSNAGHNGWRRAPCPSCAPDGVQKSPSFTARANGDGVDLHCHSGCSRRNILDSLHLSGEIWVSPSNLKLDLDEQLEEQKPEEAAMDVDAAGELLEQEFVELVRDQKLTVLKYPAGTGKSYRCAAGMATLAREGLRLCYATQEHVVAHETRAKLPPDVKERSVHIHSPLIKVGDEPVCQRAEELKPRVFEFGVSLMGSICPRCKYKDECEALAAAKDRQKKLPEAQIIFVSHAGINQVFGVDADGKQKGAGIRLIVDEMPGTFEEVKLGFYQISRLANGVLLQSCTPVVGKVVKEVARAWLAGDEPGDVYFADQRVGNAAEMAAQWGRVTLREDARPSPAEKALLAEADALLRLYAHKEAGGPLQGAHDPGHEGVSAMMPDACHEALVRTNGVLLSATPFLPALDGFELRDREVKDSAPVRRVMVLRNKRGSGALGESYYDDDVGIRVRREREEGEEPGIPWPAVDEALARAIHEADRYSPTAKVLLVTFKKLADVLRNDGDRLRGGRICVAHFGATRGKNDWEEGRENACQVVYCFGTPRFGILPTLHFLGLKGDAATKAWRDYAAAELTQAEGRLRLPRRKTPCTVVVEGDVAPSSWHTDNVSQVIADADAYETTTGLLESALRWRTVLEVAELLGVDEQAVRRSRQPGRPPLSEEHLETLRRLAFPPTSEALGVFSRLTVGRRLAFDASFSWAALDTEQ